MPLRPPNGPPLPQTLQKILGLGPFYLPLLPVLLAQAGWVRWRLPELIDASGPTSGLACPGPATTEPPSRLLLVGESPVAGVGVEKLEQALAGQLGTALSCRWQHAVHWQAVGKTGATASEAITDLLPRLGGLEADLLAIDLGVNDSVRLTPNTLWRAALGGLLDQLERQFPGVPTVLIGLPPVGKFPGFPRPLAAVLGARARRLDRVTMELAAARPRVHHLPSLDQGDPAALFGPDGFHLARQGYTAWAEQIADRIVEFFPQAPRNMP